MIIKDKNKVLAAPSSNLVKLTKGEIDLFRKKAVTRELVNQSSTVWFNQTALN